MTRLNPERKLERFVRARANRGRQWRRLSNSSPGAAASPDEAHRSVWRRAFGSTGDPHTWPPVRYLVAGMAADSTVFGVLLLVAASLRVPDRVLFSARYRLWPRDGEVEAPVGVVASSP
jgi:hypothetical protein